MQIKKEDPKHYIIADTKINTQSFESYCSLFNKDFEQTWIKHNGKAQQTSQSEKLATSIANDMLQVPLNNENKELMKDNFGLYKQLFQHIHVTVVFDNVSHIFLENILLNKVDAIVNKKENDHLGLWLPKELENSLSTSLFGYLVGDIAENINKFIEKASNDIDPKEAIKLALKMAPMAKHLRLIVTSSINGWRNLILELTKLGIDDQTRFVMLHLYRDMKIRYNGFFNDFAIVNDGKCYGTESIANDGFWIKSSVKSF